VKALKEDLIYNKSLLRFTPWERNFLKLNELTWQVS
jgi:hypothetical protein